MKHANTFPILTINALFLLHEKQIPGWQSIQNMDMRKRVWRGYSPV